MLVFQNSVKGTAYFGKYENAESLIIQNVIRTWTKLIADYKKLPYDLKYASKKIDDVLRVLIAITKLDKETYIRNFSTALFKDSKKFQKEFKSIIESILFDYTDEVLEKIKYWNSITCMRIQLMS